MCPLPPNGIGGKSLKNIAKKARDRKFDCEGEKLLIEEKHVADAQRSGVLKTATGPAKTEQVLNLVRQNRSTRQYSSEYLAYQCEISGTSVCKIMKANNLYKVKITKKPGLTPSMKEARLQFCLRYQNWTLEDWKAVIWSDKTSVVLRERRGSQRIWRTPGEMHYPDIIYRR
jgi:hypothetical protein